MLKDKLRNLIQVCRHPLVGQSAIVAASNYLAAGFGFLTALVAARLLGPSDYGLVALAIAYPSLVWSICSVKSEGVTIRYLSRFKLVEANDAMLSICKLGYIVDLVSAGSAAVIIGVTARWVAESVYQQPDLMASIVVYGTVLPLRALASTSIGILSTWGKFQWIASAQLFDRLGTFVLVTVVLLAGSGVAGMVLVISVLQALVGLGLFIVANLLLKTAELSDWWKAPLKEIVPLKQELQSFLGWSYLTTTLAGLVEQIPLMLLGRFRGPEEAGFLRLATSMVTVASYLEGSLGRVTYPRLSAQWLSGNAEAFRETLVRMTTRAGGPAALCLLAVIPLFPPLVPRVFGETYVPMVTGVQVLVGTAASSALFFWLSSAYFAAGRVQSWAHGYIIYTAALLLLAYLATSTWGFFGTATVIGLSKLLFSLVMAWMILKPDRLSRESESTVHL